MCKHKPEEQIILQLLDLLLVALHLLQQLLPLLLQLVLLLQNELAQQLILKACKTQHEVLVGPDSSSGSATQSV